MVHAAAGFARTLNRLQAMACSASVGPGSTNMLTGAAVATTNRQPVLLLPSDVFATAGRQPGAAGAGAPDRVRRAGQRRLPPAVAGSSTGSGRPEQLPHALLGGDAGAHRPGRDRRGDDRAAAGRAGRGWDWPEDLFAERVWHIARPAPDPAAVARAVEVIRSARTPLIVAGGGVHLQRGHRAAAPLRRGHRDPGRRHPGRQGRDPLGPPPGRRRGRLHRLPRRQRAGRRGRRRHRHRHPLQRLHDRVARPRSRTRTCGSSTSTSPRSTPSSVRRLAGRRRPRRARAR